MSVVLSYADKNIAFIACDGRVVDNKNNIVSEDYKKFLRINKNVILGFAGELWPCEAVAKMLSNPSQKELIQQLSFDNIFGCVKLYCEKLPLGTQYGFVMCGVENGQRIITANIEAHSSPQINHVTGNKILYQGLYPKELQNRDVFRDYLVKFAPIDAAKLTIEHCAKHSPSVNNNIYLDYITVKTAV